MSRNRHGRHREREDPASSHWEPEYRRYYSEYSRRRYEQPIGDFLPRNGHNHRRDSDVRNSYYPQRSYGRENHRDRWRDDDDGRSWRAESSYSRRRRDFGPGRDQDDRESWRNTDRNSSHRNTSRRRHSTYSSPYTTRPATIRPIEPTPSLPKPAPPELPQKASPPPMSPQPLKPSPGYLALSDAPSETLRDPATTRKLLVLDLNGTLLVRSARSRNTSGPQLRSVQPRPYMQSFKQYLFCLETKAWLDTMVWSSAQPHSVDDMVEKVFGSAKGELKAVWNRKSLGLSEEDYHRKALTTKDLSKPWGLFASALSPEKLPVSSQSQVIHSALTTLLLDDSPHKATLQPYNHVCIPEYDSTRRQQDVRTFLATWEPKQNRKAKRKSQVETAAHTTNQTVPELLPTGVLTDVAEKESYDVILLAVIGILETVKLQSNIAGWIRKGGLWATQERGSEGDARNVAKTGGGRSMSNTVVRTGNDATSTSRPAVTTEQAHLQSKMWFEEESVMVFWVARGRTALMELGIQTIHGVTG